MKIIIRNNDGKQMLEFTNLCIIKKDISYQDGTIYGYSAIIKYPGNDEIYYEKPFTVYSYSNQPKALKAANEHCNIYIDNLIGKIQTEVTNAKKRHSEFTEIIELD